MTTSTPTSSANQIVLVPEIRQAIEKRLGIKKELLLREIEELCRRNPVDFGNDPLDRVEAGNMRQETNWRLSIARTSLSQVDLAFRRIAENRYGICGSCENPIPLERLDLIPETLFCVGCQTKQERRH
jgi:DnaK suppressor protein